MRSKRWHQWRLLAILASFALVMVACSGAGDADKQQTTGGTTAADDSAESTTESPKNSSDPSGEEPKYGGIFRDNRISDADTLDPLTTAAFNVHYRVGLASSRLLQLDLSPEYAYGEAPMKGDLAESWDISDDLLTYTFKLRDDVFWHDIPPVNGRKFVADDVVATFKAIQERGFQAYMLENVISIEAPDELTVVLKLSEPFTPLLNYMGNHHMWIIPREGIEGEYDIAKQTIGTGPFVMTKWEQNVTTEYERNPNYYEEGIPYLDGVTMPVIPDQGARIAAFRAGELDALDGLSRRELDSVLASTPGSVMRTAIGASPTRLFLNMSKPPFDDLRVRKAINMAIDREGIGSGIYESGSYTGPVNVHVARFALSQDELKSYQTFDPDQARQLLAEAGYPDGFSANLMVTAAYGPTTMSVAEWVVSDLADIGIKVDIETVDYATYITQRWPQLQYDMGVGPQTPFQEADEWLRAQFHSEGSRNWYGINDPDLDEMIMEQIRIVDEGERIEKVQDIQRYILENIVDPLELWIADGFIALSKDVRNYYSQPEYGYGWYAYLWLDR